MLSKTNRTKWAALGLAAMLSLPAAYAQTPNPLDPTQDQDGGSASPSMGPGLLLSPFETENSSSQSLPAVDLTGEIVFQVLASEVAAQRGSFSAATGTSLELARFTRDPRLARRAVEFAMAGGDVVRALDGAQLWAELDPKDPEARQTALTLAAAANKVDGLGAALRSNIASTPAADKGRAIIETRRILSRLEDKKRALSILEEALTDVRDLPESHIALADGSAAAGDIPRALQEARAAQALQPDSAIVAMLALQYGIQVDPDKSVAAARAFIAAHPDSRNMRVLLARALASTKDYDGALAELQSMAVANPKDVDVLYLQGVISYQAGKLPQADDFLSRYVDAQAQARAHDKSIPPSAEASDAQFLRVQIAEDQNRLDDAFNLLAKVDDPRMALTARLRQAVIRSKQNRLDDADHRAARPARCARSQSGSPDRIADPARGQPERRGGQGARSHLEEVPRHAGPDV
jgi:tetratricopeptide (TPR) repeat protein